MRRLLIACLATAMSTGLAFAQTNDGETDTVDSPSIAAPTEPSQEGLEAWAKLNEVFSHPRCANCHVEDDRPRWTGPHYENRSGNHAMNVRRGDDGFGNPGLTCQTCHSETNSEKLYGPPGAKHWHLAPVEMVWFKNSSAEICAQIKDPERNGQRTLSEIADHVRDDPLVAWGWNPGKGREPAPGSAEEAFALLQVWIDEGAPCPSE